MRKDFAFPLELKRDALHTGTRALLLVQRMLVPAMGILFDPELFEMGNTWNGKARKMSRK